MNRRDFLTVAASAGAVSVGNGLACSEPQQPASASTPKPFKLKYAPHFGMFEHHAKDELDQIIFAADEGFAAWEDNGMAGRDKDFQDRFAQRMLKHNMQMGIFVAHHIDWQNPTLTTGDAAIRDRFVSDIKASTEVAKRINATWVTTVIGRVAQNIPMGHQFANVIEALRRAADVCETATAGGGARMVMVIEPLNWRDHPGQFGNTSDVLRAVVKAVDHPSVKILQDLYHLQVTEGNLIDNMDRSWDDIAYFQTGDNPGRCEPGTGEVNYRSVFKHIHERGYTGILGMEHGASVQGKEGERRVIEAYRGCDAF